MYQEPIPLIHTLSNGIRIVHSHNPNSEIAHCGLMLDIGSRDESAENQGIAHFWEHMAFKGTHTRMAHHISDTVESLGGDINAFTDKEKILFYVSIRSVHLARAVELLVDITFNSTFPEAQIRRERSVILEEMAMYADDPEELLQDEFDGMIFADHALGMNILGTKKTLQKFSQGDFRAFVDNHLDTHRIVLSCVGNWRNEDFLRLAEHHLAPFPQRSTTQQRTPFVRYTPQQKNIRRDLAQMRCAMGRVSYSLRDNQRIGFSMLTHLLGGSGIGSRLNRVLREKYGYVYAVGAQYVAFTDTGLFVISFGTDAANFDNSLRLIQRELALLRDKPVGSRLLNATREQVITRLLMGQENGVGLMMSLARDLLDLDRLVTHAELCAAVGDVTPAHLSSLAQEMLDEKTFCTLVLEPQ